MTVKTLSAWMRSFLPGGIAGVLLLSSCAGLEYQRLDPAVPERPVETPAASPAAVPAEGVRGAAAPPERPIPEPPLRILGAGQVPEKTLSRFLLAFNSTAEEAFAEELAEFYTEESEREGVNHDVAFSQMCLETGFLRFGNLVSREMNNFCGLGAIGPEQRGEVFSEPRIGVRAHIQHLKAYATEEPLRGELVDPRYRWVRYGSAPTIYGLAGTWAADREYGNKILNILEELYRYYYQADAAPGNF
jgi:hypothetical protein